MVINKYHFGNRVPPGAINIMRGTPFGNPFEIGKDGDRDAVIAKYREWLWARLKSESLFRQQVKALNKKDLCCCCAPKACHGNVLEKAAAWLSSLTADPFGEIA